MTTHIRKALYASIALVMLLGITSTQNNASAQLNVGGGLAFGLDIESIGVQAGGTYFLLEEQGVRLAADIIFFFPSEDGLGFDLNVFEFNANAHYIFNEGDAYLLYALAGLVFDRVSVDVDLGPFGSDSVSDTEVGLNVGAGTEYSIGGVKLYGEAKLILGGYETFVISGGIRVPIGN